MILAQIQQEEFQQDLEERATEMWKAAKQLGEVRTAVAHNPAAYGWHGTEGEGAPHFVGIQVVRKLRGNTNGQVPYIGINGVNRAIDEVIELVRDLEKTSDEVRATLIEKREE